MKPGPALDDLALFLAVADAGSLSAAAAITGIPLPTCSRRMTGLERQTGRRLFLRGARGYALTAEGRALAGELGGLRDIRRRVEGWMAGDGRPLRVRITSGALTSTYLARHIHDFWTPGAGWVPEFLPTSAMVDIARREADIGIRNAEPTQGWLARRPAGQVTMSAYATAPEVTDYIAIERRGPPTPSQAWLRENAGDRIATTASDPRLCIDLARAGLGRVILPDHTGAEEPGLVPVTGPIPELTHTRWLVSHHDARHDPPVRAALDALARLLTAPAR